MSTVTEILVPSDGSADSMRAVPVALSLAGALGCRIRVVSYSNAEADERLRSEIEDQLVRFAGEEITLTVDQIAGPVATFLADDVAASPSPILCMTTRGLGRSAALFGSVAADVLERVLCPVVLVGPKCSPGGIEPGGNLLVTTDGSDFAATVVPVAAELAQALALSPSVVSVFDPDDIAKARATLGSRETDPFSESGPVRRLAEAMSSQSGREAGFDTLHGDDPSQAIVDYAKQTNPSLIALATHDRHGLHRLLKGSVMSAIVRHAPCPVVTVHPQP